MFRGKHIRNTRQKQCKSSKDYKGRLKERNFAIFIFILLYVIDLFFFLTAFRISASFSFPAVWIWCVQVCGVWGALVVVHTMFSVLWAWICVLMFFIIFWKILGHYLLKYFSYPILSNLHCDSNYIYIRPLNIVLQVLGSLLCVFFLLL